MNKDEYLKMFELEDSHWWFAAKRRFVANLLSRVRLPKKATIVDVGCGTGGMTQFLSRYGNVTGIEPYSLARNLCKKRNLQVIIDGSVEKLPVKDASVDFVTLFDVLYHQNVKSENQAIIEAYRVLKPGGILLLTDSAFQFLTSPHDKAVHGKRRFTIQDLKPILEQNGFIVQKATYLYCFLFPIVVAKRMLTNIFGSPDNQTHSDVEAVNPVLNSLLYTVCSLEASLLPYVNFPWGSSLCLVARKKADPMEKESKLGMHSKQPCKKPGKTREKTNEPYD